MRKVTMEEMMAYCNRYGFIFQDAVTIDDVTLEYKTVTVRERDTMQQLTIAIEELRSYLSDKIGGFAL